MSVGLASVRVVGGLLPGDVVDAVAAGSLDGLRGADYRLGSESPREAAARVWTYLQGAYRRFRDDLSRLPEGDPAIGLTRDRWLGLVLDQLGYGRVPATPAGGITAGDKQYPVSHLVGQVPIHLLGWGVPLDTKSPGVAGAARAPHAMVQELLNRTDDHLWAILTNGRLLRLLRDSTTLTGFSYVEFDLEAMFDGDLYAEFTLLYLLCHHSRLEVADGESPTACWLERWRTTAISRGVRALNLLRDGVERALETLGTGFVQHPANTALRDRLAEGAISPADVHTALLRIVYRILFWSVVEERNALLVQEAGPEERRRYETYFSSRRLRELALARHGSNHDDLWQAVELVLNALGSREGEPRLGLPGLGGLFTRTAVDVLVGSRLPNAALLSAIRDLSVVQPKGQPRRRVNFAQLGAEELGSIYESLLELVPRYDPVSHAFTLEVLAGNDRKTSGSYYTPSDLVELVLDTALDPVLDDVEKRTATPEERAAALLDLKVCDPSVGSAHFLVAAARRIAMRLATARTGELDPTPTHYTDALHDVVARCLYGVDINPMAADLAKVSLWLTAMTPGKPLSFLDHHIKVGNALLGTTPALLKDGIPNAAFVALTGDDKATVAAWKKANTLDRKHRGQGDLFGDAGIVLDTSATRQTVTEVTERLAATETVDDVAWAAQRYATLRDDPTTVRNQLVADTWCAAFLTPKVPGAVPVTDRVLQQVADGTAPAAVTEAVRAIAQEHKLFHWHLEFPEVFRSPIDGPAHGAYGWLGGFDAVVGNPPWERVKLQEEEFFATRAPEISVARNAASRKKMIALLEGGDRDHLFQEFLQAKRRSEAASHLLRTGGRYPLTGIGDVNTYQVFAEHFRATISVRGRSGIITPTGLATDATTAQFFADTLAASRLAAFYDFENESKLFAGVHHAFRFAVSVMTGGERARDVRLAFLLRSVTDVHARQFELLPEEVLLLNPNTGTLPIFRSRRDADITLACYRAHPVLVRDGAANPWGLTFATLFHMANDSELFRGDEELAAQGAEYDGWAWTRGLDTWLPLYEGKLLSHWDHRASTYDRATEAQLRMQTLPRLSDEEHDDPALEALPRYWLRSTEVRGAVPEQWDRDWLLGWRDITGQEKWRTVVPCALPLSAVGHVFPLVFSATPTQLPLLHAVWSSLVFDYIARQKLSGTHLTYGVLKQLAMPSPEAFEHAAPWSGVPLEEFIRARVVELTYTTNRMAGYAADVLPGDTEVGRPFRWIPGRRSQLTAELDAAMFHLYGLDRADVEHVLESFPVVRKNELRDFGEFRTKRLVLDAFDAMTTATETGKPFVSPLDPVPGRGPRHPEVNP